MNDPHPEEPVPDCINHYTVYDPDAWRYGKRRRITPLEVAIVLAGFFIFLSFGLRPAVGTFVGIAELFHHVKTEGR